MEEHALENLRRTADARRERALLQAREAVQKARAELVPASAARVGGLAALSAPPQRQTTLAARVSEFGHLRR